MLKRLAFLVLIASLAGLPSASARFLLHSGGGSPATSSIVQQWSFFNNGSGTSPGPSSMTPAHTLVSLAPGAVPLGQIAVPFVAGVAVPYGADCAVDGVNPLRSDGCPSWPDGSLKYVPMSMYVPQLAAAGTEMVQFKTQAGAYSASSSILPSSITAISDYNVVLTGVNSSWVPQYYGVWPNGTQIGCQVSGGSVTSCNLRVIPPTAAAQGPTTCATYDIAVGNIAAATIDNGSGSPGNILTITSGGGGLFVAGGWSPLPEILTDNTGNIAPGTVITAVLTGTGVGVGTYSVSGAPQLVASEPMGLMGCSGRINNGINNTGGGTPAVFTTTRGANNMPNSVTVLSGGTGYTTIGSGTLKFDVNTLLNEYGSNDPPTCAAELGAGAFSSVTYMAGPPSMVVVNTVTSGHIATGQILTDSTGATAVVTGTSSPWKIVSNTGGTATLTSGAMTATTPACVWADSSYAGQPLKKSYWVRGPFIDTGTGLPDAQMIGSAQVDIWSLGGSPYSVRAIARVDREGWQPGQWFQSYTYNATVYNGTAAIRGDALGTGVYTGITDESPGDWYTADPALAGPLGTSARMDWLGAARNSFSESNNLAINAVNPYLGSGDINFLRGAHVMLPLNSSTIPSPEIIPVSTTNGSWDNPVQFQGVYMPFGPMFVDATPAFGSGGDAHFFLGPQGANLSFWISATSKATDHGLSWLNQMRVGALAISGDVSGVAESDTGHALNLDPNFSNPAFTDPTRLGSAYQNCGAGSPCFVSSVPTGTMATGGQFNVHGDQGDASHWPSGTVFGPYVVDGEYYQLKQMDLMATEGEWSNGDNGRRTLSYNGHNYYGVMWDNHEIRTYAWAEQLVNQFVNFAPPQEPDAQYWTWIKNVDNYASYAGFYPWIGTWSIAQGGTTGSKGFNWTPAGTCSSAIPHTLEFNPPNTGEVTWMCGYAAGVELLDQLWAGGPGNNAALDTLVTEAADNFLVKESSVNSCPYNAVNYGQVTGLTTTGAPGTSYDNTDIPGSPPGSLGQTFATAGTGGNFNTLISVGGSSTVSLITLQNSTNPIPPPNGSILNPTRWQTQQEAASAPLPPSPLVTGTWQALCSVQPGASFTGTTSGTGLTITGSVTGTPLAANQYIAGAGITPYTFYITGGGPTVWTLSGTPAAVGPEAMTTWPTGTINPYASNAGSCSSPAPITLATTTQFNAGWITNQSCLTPPGFGDWAFPGDFNGSSAYPAIFWAIMNWRVAVGGTTADTTAAIANFTSVGLPTVPAWSTQVNWNACTSLTC